MGPLARMQTLPAFSWIFYYILCTSESSVLLFSGLGGLETGVLKLRSTFYPELVLIGYRKILPWVLYVLNSRWHERLKRYKYNNKVIFVLMTVKAKQRWRDIKLRVTTKELALVARLLKKCLYEWWRILIHVRKQHQTNWCELGAVLKGSCRSPCCYTVLIEPLCPYCEYVTKNSLVHFEHVKARISTLISLT